MFSIDVLAVIFVVLFAVSAIVYAILDGYDLGVGILLPVNNQYNESERDLMISTIGPFWDANETWIVLTIGILLIAFPEAYNLLLSELYIPIFVMLIGLILRGVAFDFRSKASIGDKLFWDRVFKGGSITVAATQGYMLGSYIMGFEQSLSATLFCCMTAIGVIGAYSLIGSTWLVMKTEGKLRAKSIAWAKIALVFCGIGVLLVSIVSPWVNELVANRWFSGGNFWYLIAFPAICLLAFVYLANQLLALTGDIDKDWVPFVVVVVIFLVTFAGLAISFFPWVIPNQLTIWETVAGQESLMIVAVGAILVLPIILAYTAYTYYVFRGKTTKLTYG